MQDENDVNIIFQDAARQFSAQNKVFPIEKGKLVKKRLIRYFLTGILYIYK